MAITLNGTTGITNDGGYTGDGVVFADTTPASTLVTTTGGNVGIGTASPAAKLDVNGSVNYTGTLTGGTGVVNLGSGQLYKDASGNVGIGTSSPVNRLHVAGATTTQVQVQMSGQADMRIISDTGYGALSVESAMPLIFRTSATERARIDSSGNLGIGTTSPANKLQIAGVSGVSAALDMNQGIATGNEFSALKFTASANGFIGSEIRGISTNGGTNLGVMAFHTSATEKMRLDSSGNLLLGTTTNNPVGDRINGHKFLANGGYNSRTVASNRDWGISVTSGSIVNFYSDNGSAFVYAGAINVTGNVTSYTSVSDYRLKENVQPIVGALAKVQQLKPVTFAFKYGGQLSEGFIAHELQAVVPDCVTGTKDAVDAEGKPIYQGIDTSFLVATLTAAIQEQQVIIESLTARITALETAP